MISSRVATSSPPGQVVAEAVAGQAALNMGQVGRCAGIHGVDRVMPDDLALTCLATLHRMVCESEARVYLHCIAGQNRSPTVLWLYLVACGLPPEQAKVIIEARQRVCRVTMRSGIRSKQHASLVFHLGNFRVPAFAARRPRPTNPAFGFPSTLVVALGGGRAAIEVPLIIGPGGTIPSPRHTMAATNKCLAKSNKSEAGGKATNQRSKQSSAARVSRSR